MTQQESIDRKYMARALQIARAGELHTSPNPMVGCVIVAGDHIIGEGFHRRCGEGHAEVNAVRSVNNPKKFREATVYVTLEPCAHYGKTPPCAKLLIECGVKRVVVGSVDPFALVAGRGITMLREAGIEVTTGVMEHECEMLNKHFFTAHKFHRPFVTLKWAQSADGFMDVRRDSGETALRFSTKLTTTFVHHLRSTHDAILIGSGTYIADNPALTVRHWGGDNPVAVVADRTGNITSLPAGWLHLKEDKPLLDTLRRLYSEHNITSLLVEGGPTLLHSFIAESLWDEARVETAPFYLSDRGCAKAPIIPLAPDSLQIIDNRKIFTYTKKQFQ